ncbi:MAG: DUF2807 domain-containing protein, partial [Helicobacter sp.]|nr:DUF2807 domain-containing protein [Helicobacter sp.]
ASSSAEASFAKVNAVEVTIDASSSAGVVAEALLCGTVEANASSAANIEISGSADKSLYEASSAATIDAGALNVGKLVKAKATSAATIDYRASSVGSVSESSAGSVNRKK